MSGNPMPGRILRGALGLVMDWSRATRWATTTGQVMAMVAETFFPANNSTMALTIFDIKNANVDSDGTVTFNLPLSGASGTFGSGVSTTVTAVTDSNGIATSPAIKANTKSGTYFAEAKVAGSGTALARY